MNKILFFSLSLFSLSFSFCQDFIEHIKWTDTLASLKFKGTVLPYTAGQFTKVGLKVDGELISRPYSYVSAPTDDYLEIVYVNVPDG